VALTDLDEIRERLRGQVDLIVDGGPCGVIATTVVDLTGDVPEVVRQGAGSFEGG
jgi:tRNA A37 threonylcarbamoyladenosine synthetase subunit TsaC/SUA5/YrdC